MTIQKKDILSEYVLHQRAQPARLMPTENMSILENDENTSQFPIADDSIGTY